MKLTQEQVIEQFNIKHNNKFGYSKMIYLGDNKNIIITCPIHGDFEQTPSNHKRGQNCPKCAGRGLTNNELIEIFNHVHNNKFDYSEMNYINNSTKINIICPIHGKFSQTPNNHKRGQGCNECYGIKLLTIDEAIANFVKTHGSKYDYSKTIYKNAHTKVIITCLIHGDFEQTPNNHKNGNGCPICCESNGETKIRVFLEDNEINFIPQYKFPDCKNILQLPFDFYLPDDNICIEFNGIQHYKPVKHFNGKIGFEARKINDKIKKEYCHNNNIPLVTIKYNDNVLERLLVLKSSKFTIYE